MKNFKLYLVLAVVSISTLAFLRPAMSNFGLDNPEAAGPFFNNTFPASTPTDSVAWQVVNAYPNLTFIDPLLLTEVPRTDRFLVVGKTGIIWTFDKNDTTTSQKAIFLNINPQVRATADGGLLGFVFHPEFGQPGSPNRGYFYVWYCFKYDPANNTAGYLRLSRFNVPVGSSVADPNSEFVMINQYDRSDWHNGGGMFFGTDGFLYIASGDEGGSADLYGVTQKINEGLFSGVLRIDVDMDPAVSHPIRRQPTTSATMPAGWPASSSQGYFIPNDNPWQNTNGSILEEFYAIGLRSPHRMSYDSVTGQIWLGDVGQAAREEVNLIRSGHNYQWVYREGTMNTGRPKPANVLGIEAPPVFEYSHSVGVCVIGGPVYRGAKWNSLLGGKYLFGDHGTRNIYAMDYNPVTGAANVNFLVNVPAGGMGNVNGVSHIATDSAGDIYILKLFGLNRDGGVIYKLVASPPVADAPPTLSQTGVFSNLSTLETAPGFIPYQLNVPFWSDNAIKTRWIMVPNDGSHNTPAEKITYSADGEWKFPVGTVIIKHFELALDESNPSVKRRLETRFIIHGTDGQYYGLTYRWRDDQTDADLLTTSRVDTFSIATPANGPRELTWYYPDRQQCKFCHNQAAGYVLGPKSRQLNGDAFYSETGRTANQIKTMAHLGMFDVPVDTSAAGLASLFTSRATNDPTASLENRARAYLDANCASCHRSGSSIMAKFDARNTTPLDLQGLIYGGVSNSIGLWDPKVIVPEDPGASVLYARVNSVHRNYSMPPLAKNLIDPVGAQLIYDWIQSVSPSYTPPANQVVGRFRTDYAPGSPNGTWSYLWNSGGTLGNMANYTQLIWNGTHYDSDGVPGSPDPTVLWNGHMDATGGSPGPGTSQSQGGSIARNLIAAYRTATPGNYEIISSSVTHTNSTCGDGSEVRIFVNNNQRLVVNVPRGSTRTFNVSLGQLQEGDQIFVAFGPKAHDTCDDLLWDFSIRRISAPGGQRITFPPIASQAVGNPPINLNATASSGLPVTYTVVSGPASLSGNQLVLSGQPGRVVVRASQAGNSSFAVAPQVERSFWVTPVGAGTGTGLLGSYYDDLARNVLKFTRVDPKIDFYWGAGSPDPSMQYNTFSTVWEGEIEPPISGQWTLSVTGDDGVRLFVGNLTTPLIDAWQDQEATEFTATVNFTAWQKVPIRLEYFENRAYSEVQLAWSHATLSKTPIPAEFMYPAAGSVFPVELLDFTAMPAPGGVSVDWITENEVDLSHYMVERSTDGVMFSDIGAVPAKGKSADLQTYQFIDTEPFRGRSYYRLRMIDIDGSFDFSNIEMVVLEGRAVSVFPNPARIGNTIHVELDFPGIQPAEVRLLDAKGAVRFSHIIYDVQRKHELDIPTSGMSPGVYLLYISNGAIQEVRKLVIY